MRFYSLPMFLMNCLPLLSDFVFVAIGVVINWVGGICQNDCFFGRSPKVDASYLESEHFLLVAVTASIREVSLFRLCTLYIVEIPPLPTSLIGLSVLFYRMIVPPLKGFGRINSSSLK